MVNFALMQHHNWSLSELDEMLPYERAIYLNYLITHLEEVESNKQKQG